MSFQGQNKPKTPTQVTQTTKANNTKLTSQEMDPDYSNKHLELPEPTCYGAFYMTDSTL